VIVGHPASAGRATGPVRIVHGPQDFAEFRDGDVLVAKATVPDRNPMIRQILSNTSMPVDGYVSKWK
jgi:phosphoenolpyruvate synthase/pyruvate phosphate dikinase